MSLATIEPAHGFTREQLDLIKNTIAKGATDEELSLFVATCNRLGLDPFARQIYLVRRWDSRANRMVAQSQVSIDGFRLVAEKTRQYRGQTQGMWCGYDGQWHEVWFGKEPPAAAKVGVWREGAREPLVRVARYDAFVQTDKQGNPTHLWRTMPDVMLLKCAEAQALRACFPNELANVYSAEEMGQASNASPPPESFPLASLPAPEAQQAPQAPEYEPPATERRPAQVLEFRAAQGRPEGESEVSREALEMFGPKLRQCQNRDQLVTWMRQVIAHGFEDSAKRALFNLWSRQVRACLRGADPNVLLAEAKRGGAK